RKGERFLIRLADQPDADVFPESENKFFAVVVDAQFSFTSDRSGRVTGLVLHQNGLEMPSPRVDAAKAQAEIAALALRIKNQTQTPDTEIPMRRFIEADVAGKPDFSLVDEGVAVLMRKQAPVTMAEFRRLGALKSFKFTGVGPAG